MCIIFLIYYLEIISKIDEDNPESRRKARIARFRFDEITEAYQTLMDPNQRYFYDQHGYAPEALRYRTKTIWGRGERGLI